MAKYGMRPPGINRDLPIQLQQERKTRLDQGMDYFDWRNVVDMWYKEVDIFDEHNVTLM